MSEIVPKLGRKWSQPAKNGPKMVSKMAPKWLPGGLKMAPWRLLGGLWRPWGALGRPRRIFERFWVLFGDPLWDPKSIKKALKKKLKSNIAFDAYFEPSGGPLGHFWGHFGGILGCFLRSRAGKQDFSKTLKNHWKIMIFEVPRG